MKVSKFVLYLFLVQTFSIRIWAEALPTSTVIGSNILTAKSVEVSAKSKKGLVAIFLSAVCPCSNSHIKEIASLSKEYPEFSFVGIHSNVDESLEKSKPYFKQIDLPFPVIQDVEAKIANQFKALKTPHAFILLPNGKVVYQGGVSSSRKFEEPNQKFLREALDDLKNDRQVRTAEGRTLGCVISRGEKFVW